MSVKTVQRGIGSFVMNTQNYADGSTVKSVKPLHNTTQHLISQLITINYVDIPRNNDYILSIKQRREVTVHENQSS